MTKVHGKRYAYKFDFRGLSQALQSGANADRYGYQPCNQVSSYGSKEESCVILAVVANLFNGTQ